ncbi:membrane-associated protein, putative [Bodo saltans]|uniref:Membrane-associated protein, putative n=1 Tax=Bodo saltans TaxID=75058 RepID=A0A0S4IY73_BODSA|nr:membrane-associated protein, putative [Bodo saltans]|eukprot:CUG51989.1 membrane-associated protein, putative [Bodo saltans]
MQFRCVLVLLLALASAAVTSGALQRLSSFSTVPAAWKLTSDPVDLSETLRLSEHTKLLDDMVLKTKRSIFQRAPLWKNDKFRFVDFP